MDILNKKLVVEMSNGLQYGVPVEIIAKHRAKYYAFEYDGDETKSLIEDTIPLFESDDYEIRDWSANNMNWSDVESYAVLIKSEKTCDYQDGWINGEYHII